MKRSKAAKILEKTAVQYGVSVAEVRGEIQKAIDDAFANESKDEYMRAFWGRWEGRKPTPEEFFSAITIKWKNGFIYIG